MTDATPVHLDVRYVDPRTLIPAPKTARRMSAHTYKQLLATVRHDHRLESTPFVAERDGVLHIVSGHHRVRAAVDAGLATIPVLVDTSGLSDEALIAKQLAHNSIVGTDDPAFYDALARQIQSPTLRAEALVTVAPPPLPVTEPAPLPVTKPEPITPTWKTLTITFVPTNEAEFWRVVALVDQLPSTDTLGVVSADAYETFEKAVRHVRRAAHVRGLGHALMVMARLALREYGTDTTRGARDE